ncbi:MAG: hypothetical protein WCB94_02740 [Terriglobales bacterium]
MATGIETMKSESNTASALFNHPKPLIFKDFTLKSFKLKDLEEFSP